MSLNAERQRRLLAVFEETMLQEPLAREAFVDRACCADPELLSDVLRLLVVEQELGAFLEHPTNLLSSAVADEEQFCDTDRFVSCAVWARAEWGLSDCRTQVFRRIERGGNGSGARGLAADVMRDWKVARAWLAREVKR